MRPDKKIQAPGQKKSWSRIFLQLLPGILMVLVWQYAADRWVSAVFLGMPSRIVVRLYEYIASGSMLVDTWVTAKEVFFGYVIGGVIGLFAGFFLGRSPRLNEIFNPYIVAFYGVPKVALAPIFIIWFGLGLWSKVAVAALMVFFQVFYYTYLGMTSLNEEFVNLSRIMGASPSKVTTSIVLPSTLPFIFTGFKTSVPYAVIGAIVGEFTASNKGLGYFILYSGSTFDSAGLFAGVFVLVGLVVAVNWMLERAERKYMPWKRIDGIGVGE